MASLLPSLSRRGLPTLNGLVFKQLPPLHTTINLPSPFQNSYLPAIVLPLLAHTAFSGLHGALSSIWESILLAVPKKKTSYSRKRSRQLAGKALKDVTSINFCSSCGRPKRAHVLCSHCVQLVRDIWTNNTTRNTLKTDKVVDLKAAKETKSRAAQSSASSKPNSTWKERFQSIWGS